MVMDRASMIPVVGAPFALASAGISASRDDTLGMSMSLLAIVPLLLSEAYHAKVDVPEVVAAATARHPGLQIRATKW